MKLSSGLGLPAVAQSFNAKGVMGPYVWAHNAVGETITGDDPGIKQVSGITGSVSTGVSLDQGSGAAVFRLWEENSSKKSGDLNTVDTNRGRYLHLVVSFTGPGTAVGSAQKINSLWWFLADSVTDYGPIDGFNSDLGHQPVASTNNEKYMGGSTIVRGHTTILVYDMLGSTLQTDQTISW